MKPKAMREAEDMGPTYSGWQDDATVNVLSHENRAGLTAQSENMDVDVHECELTFKTTGF